MLCSCCEYSMFTPVITPRTDMVYSSRTPVHRCGLFCYDPATQRVLIMQSYGKQWGIPKGRREIHETPLQCALRETLEETGVSVQSTRVHAIALAQENHTIFFATYHPRWVTLDPYFRPRGGDSTGYAWVHLNCIRKAPYNSLNYHIRNILRRIRWVHVDRVIGYMHCMHCNEALYVNLSKSTWVPCACQC